MERTGKRWLRAHSFPADQGLALHHPVTNRLVLSTPLGPLPGAKDTEPPAQGPLCSRTRARIDFQMSRKSKQTKALHYLQSSLELSVMGKHREEPCGRQSCSLFPASQFPPWWETMPRPALRWSPRPG